MVKDNGYDDRTTWTVSALLELMNERDRRYQAAFDAAKEAVLVAEAHAEKWRANANEWRDAMNDRERDFLPRMIGYLIGFLALAATVLSIYGMVQK